MTVEPPARASLIDKLGRRLDYLRVSLTERCNFRCPFCMPPGTENRASGGERLTVDEIARLCGIFAGLGVDAFKLTGGEPFMHPDAVSIMARLKRDHPNARVGATTNGSTLDRHAGELVDAGIDGVNVSLNAMAPALFDTITGGTGKLEAILDNIRLARRLGLAVKLNMVPIDGVNASEIIPFTAFAQELGVDIKFIELMPIGRGRLWRGLQAHEVRVIVENRFGRLEPVSERLGNGPAVYYRLAGGDGPGIRVGFIAALSQCFCAGCNRLRLSSTGFLRTCLHHGHGIDLGQALRDGSGDADIGARIRRAAADKPERHRFASAPTAKGREDVPMHRIGG